MNEYDYRGLITQAWDLFLGDTSKWADRFFYLEAIRRYGGPVLDVGCGTGRLLLDFLSQGIDAWSPATRSYAQAQSRRLYEDAGFSDIQLYAGYTWEPAKDDDTLWTIVGHRQAGHPPNLHDAILTDSHFSLTIYAGGVLSNHPPKRTGAQSFPQTQPLEGITRILSKGE